MIKGLILATFQKTVELVCSVRGRHQRLAGSGGALYSRRFPDIFCCPLNHHYQDKISEEERSNYLLFNMQARRLESTFSSTTSSSQQKVSIYLNPLELSTSSDSYAYPKSFIKDLANRLALDSLFVLNKFWTDFWENMGILYIGLHSLLILWVTVFNQKSLKISY